MTLKRLWTSLFSILLFVGPLSFVAEANGQAPGGDDQTSGPNGEATTHAKSEKVVDTSATSAREHVLYTPEDPPCAEWAPPPPPPPPPSFTEEPGGDESGGEAGEDEPYFDPALWGEYLTDPGPDPTPTPLPGPPAEPECLVYYHCGGERIDEVFTGEISDEPPQAYSEYVHVIGYVVLWFTADPEWDPTTVEGFTNLSDVLLAGGLDPQPNPLLMPVFYFCRYGEGGPIELVEPVYSPSFGWDTEVFTEYDVISTRSVLVDELEVTLKANKPELKAIPPLDQGFTYVQFPMWLWLEEPVVEHTLESFSRLGTIRISIRATFDRIEWNMAGEIVSCTLEDMREYPGHDPTENVPPCSYTFRDLVDYELTAQVFYDVEEQIAYRGAVALPWPNPPWTPHPTDPVIVADQSAGDMSVHQLVALNVVGE